MLTDELNPLLLQALRDRNLELICMHELHIPKVLKLEQEIQQYASHERSEYFKTGLMKNFLEWHENDQARCLIIQSKDKLLLSYAILLLDPKIIKNFYEPSSQALENCAYLAQIVVDPKYQKGGIGKLLMNIIETMCAYNKKEHLLLEVHSLTPAYKFYLNTGYELDFFQAFMSKKLHKASSRAT